jgi:hypothetical protein
VSQGKKGSRFSYLKDAAQSTQTNLPEEAGSGEENNAGSIIDKEDPSTKPDISEGVEEGRSNTRQRRTALRATRDVLASVPKGEGRMKQDRSQLNVRLPTTLKRQATAKAVLEGRDIGEVVEELLREYLEK